MTQRAVLALAMVAFGLTSLFSGCGSKDATPVTTPSDNVSLVGTWKALNISGGESGLRQEPVRNNITVEFTEDGTLTWYEDGQPTYSSSYTTGTGETIFSLDPASVVYLRDGSVYAYSFPNPNTLCPAENCIDCFSCTYERT